MLKLSKLLFLFFLVSFLSCEDGTTNQNGSTTNPTGTDNPPNDSGETNPTDVAPPPTKPDCQIAGSVLEENLFWAKNENLLVAIVAGEETADPELGESHRILEVYDENCDRIFRNVLPVNFSPDFPYYLSDITYNNVSQVLAIRGFDKIYIFDLVKKQLSKPMEPSFLNERFAEDAQSGMIQRIEIWEDYMVGYALGEGAFVFDLSNPMDAKPVLPTAELTIEVGSDYHSLFFLKSKGDTHQAILPSYDQNTGEFKVDPLFEKPLNIETNLNRSFRNNQYLVLKELLGGNESRPIGVDMKAMKKYEIPADVANKKDTEIIAWMKKQ
jgi:hypothetical protein